MKKSTQASRFFAITAISIACVLPITALRANNQASSGLVAPEGSTAFLSSALPAFLTPGKSLVEVFGGGENVIVKFALPVTSKEALYVPAPISLAEEKLPAKSRVKARELPRLIGDRQLIRCRVREGEAFTLYGRFSGTKRIDGSWIFGDLRLDSNPLGDLGDPRVKFDPSALDVESADFAMILKTAEQKKQAAYDQIMGIVSAGRVFKGAASAKNYDGCVGRVTLTITKSEPTKGTFEFAITPEKEPDVVLQCLGSVIDVDGVYVVSASVVDRVGVGERAPQRKPAPNAFKYQWAQDDIRGQTARRTDTGFVLNEDQICLNMTYGQITVDPVP